MKEQTMTSIDGELKKKAKGAGINISQLTEDALRTKLYNADEENKGYPFELCEKKIPEHFKRMLWGCVAIRAKRCKECDEVFFVNDTKEEFTVCRKCFKHGK